MIRFCCLFSAVFLLLFSLPVAAADTGPPADMKRVVSVGDGPSVWIFALEKDHGKWRVALKTAGFVGRNGLTFIKREGDGKTPAGTYALERAFGIFDNPGTNLPYTRLTDNDCWVDDPDSLYYNQRMPCNAADREWRSAEILSKGKEAYRYALVIEYNTRPVVARAGSALFLHVSQGMPTAGCISLPEEEMKTLLRFVDQGTKITIAPSVRDLPEPDIQATIQAVTKN